MHELLLWPCNESARPSKCARGPCIARTESPSSACSTSPVSRLSDVQDGHEPHHKADDALSRRACMREQIWQHPDAGCAIPELPGSAGQSGLLPSHFHREDHRHRCTLFQLSGAQLQLPVKQHSSAALRRLQWTAHIALSESVRFCQIQFNGNLTCLKSRCQGWRHDPGCP